MMTATNSSVISGTPRTTSMKPTEASRITGRLERRPSASRIPIGSDNTMPASPATRLSMKPPNLSVEMLRMPNRLPTTSPCSSYIGNPPTSRKAAIST